MDNYDFSIFKQEVSWFFKPTDKVEIVKTKLNFSDSFISTFPTLYKLVSQATTLDIILTRKNDSTSYKLFSWTNFGNLKSGWLCKFETSDIKIEILPEHQLVLDYIGGIQESYKQLGTDKEMLTDNQNFLFIKSNCHIGLGSWKEYYDQVCDDENAGQINTKDLI